MTQARNRKTRLFCIHAPPVSEEWIRYTEYIAALLDAELVYQLGFDGGHLSLSTTMQDLIILHPPPSTRWQRALGRTVEKRLAGRGPASLLIVPRFRWPLAQMLLISRAEPADEAAIAWTRILGRAAGAAVTILPILPPIPALYSPAGGGQAEARRLLEANTPAALGLRRLRKQLAEDHIPAAICPGSGEPLWQMRAEMARCNYDLVLVGAEPASRLHHFLVGELVSPLLRSANCPVLVAHGHPALSRAVAPRPAFQPEANQFPALLRS